MPHPVIPGAPTAFRYPAAKHGGGHARLRNAVARLTGVDLFPSDEVAAGFTAGLCEGDPVAERFVAETYHGALGAREARDLVEKAQRVGIDNVPEAPESMRAQAIGRCIGTWRRRGGGSR